MSEENDSKPSKQTFQFGAPDDSLEEDIIFSTKKIEISSDLASGESSEEDVDDYRSNGKSLEELEKEKQLRFLQMLQNQFGGGDLSFQNSDNDSSPFNFEGFSGGWESEDSDDEPIEEWDHNMPLEKKREWYKCQKFYTLKDIPCWDEYAKENGIKNTKKAKRKFDINTEMNKKVSLFQGDSTSLEIDSIVNAANTSLMGGGGIDGAIHDAAGRRLRYECEKLNGCNVGETKITHGYKLPAKHVLHTVGPMDEVSSDDLESCYTTILELVDKHGLKSVAFCCISTGIYGFPLGTAAHIALRTAREYLEKNDNYKKVDRLIFVVFLEKEKSAYEKIFPKYFPLELTKEEIENEKNEEIKEEDINDDSDEEFNNSRRSRFSRFSRFSPPSPRGRFKSWEDDSNNADDEEE